MMPATNPVVDVRSFPRDDVRFRADVEAAIVAGWGQVDRIVLLADEIQTKLRARYPLVALHAQSALAVFPGQDLAIYAYRDGGVISVAPGPDVSSAPGSLATKGLMIEPGDADQAPDDAVEISASWRRGP
ncbi:MAG: hypothetical protein QOD78_2640 [Chloroflexota bacterium]|nr:hypothetical protein [Chloroflexota bacterium]